MYVGMYVGIVVPRTKYTYQFGGVSARWQQGSEPILRTARLLHTTISLCRIWGVVRQDGKTPCDWVEGQPMKGEGIQPSS